MLSEKWDVTLGLQKFGKGIWNRNISITSLKEKKKRKKSPILSQYNSGGKTNDNIYYY